MNIVQMFKAYSGMVFGKTDYWHPDMNVNQALNSEHIGKYPVDTSAKAFYEGEFDQNQIPLVLYDGVLSYLPVTIAMYALGHYDRYMDNHGPEHLQNFLRCADWFVAHLAEHRPNLWGWINDHDKEVYALKKPWLSALSQGQALSILARAYQETGNEQYLKTANKALRAFAVPVEEGGLVAKLNGGDFYEEYPSRTPSYVLNGFIFALWGLWDLYLAGANLEAKERYEAGLKTLQDNLSLYELKFPVWSRYDLYPFRVVDIGSIFYHKLHIQQLRAMHLLTHDERFNRQADLWAEAQHSKVNYLLATAYKVVHKLSIRNQANYVPSVKGHA